MKLLLLAALANIAVSWSIDGHLIVATMAENLLLADPQHKDSYDQFMVQFAYLSDYDPELCYREVNHSFVESATFADDVKYHGSGWQGDYHFVDQPWFSEGGGMDDWSFKIPSLNITDALWCIVDWASDSDNKTYQTQYLYTHLMELYPDNEDVALSFALRLLIHYAGDIVQPLHNIANVNSEWPSGDKGANEFPLPYHYEVDELHALWDKILYEWHTSIARPISDSDWAWFEPDCEDIYADYIDDAENYSYKVFNPELWAAESYAQAKSCYDGVTENEAVPQEYLDKNLPIAYRQLVLGALRLVTMIEIMYPPSNQVAFLE